MSNASGKSGTDPGVNAVSDVQVVALEPELEDTYESFVSGHPHSLLYYSLKFRDFLADLLRCEPRYAMALIDGHPAGVLPLMASLGPLGRVLNSLPFYGSNGGILATHPAASLALATWYEAEATAEGVIAATVIANPLDPTPGPAVHDLRDVRVGHVTHLSPAPGGPDEVAQGVVSSARRNVSKAMRSGVEVIVDNDGFDDLEHMHRENMAAIGGRAKTPEFFAAVPRCFRAGDDYDLYVARLGAEPVAALLVFYYGSTVEYYVPATAVQHRSIQPMAAILHGAMADARQRGCRLWNWGGSWPSQENLMRFKAKWGGRPRTYHYRTKLNSPDLLAATEGQLLDAYPGFFVVPFASLRQRGEAAHGG